MALLLRASRALRPALRTNRRLARLSATTVAEDTVIDWRSGGGDHSARRLAISSSLTSTSIVRFPISMVMVSPSRTSPIGPPSCASGHTWPITKPCEPPEKRPSRTVAGLQMGCGGKCTLISHTTHPYDVPGHVPRSEDASWGLIVVRLQAWNPWYQLAGYVEVNAVSYTHLTLPTKA